MAELERRLANLVRIGTVVAADYGAGKVRVTCDDMTTDWLPWKTRRAGGDIDWWAPEVGEQVEVIAPAGLMEGASVSPALYSDQHAEPDSSPDRHVIRYANGDSIVHDRAEGSYTIILAGQATVRAGGPVLVVTPQATVDAQNTHMTGDLLVDGQITGKGGMAISGGSGATMSVTGNMQMQGQLSVDGDVNASGTIMDAGGNSNHHSH
ncbi:phage baseplate assembly protein V [Castellaniella sp. S9]|uniref:phage baseplate assembly protein V n=1 Tax=Castellaniella sp. S9 TaxID=2993652 RepID=UPI0022B539D7|nr:phage baseplate assembly protein V [Castellaniella sp. S9]